MQDLVGEHTEAPEQGVALEVVDGGVAEGELAQLFDTLLDDSALVVASPGGDGVNALAVGEHMMAQAHLLLVETVHVFPLERPPGRDGE